MTKEADISIGELRETRLNTNLTVLERLRQDENSEVLFQDCVESAELGLVLICVVRVSFFVSSFRTLLLVYGTAFVCCVSLIV